MPRRKRDARAKWTSFFMFFTVPPGNAKNAHNRPNSDCTGRSGLTGPASPERAPNTGTRLRGLVIIIAAWKKGKWDQTCHTPRFLRGICDGGNSLHIPVLRSALMALRLHVR